MSEAPPTEHSLGDILRRILLVRAADVADALRDRPEGQRLGEALVASGAITEGELRVALEIQEGLRSGRTNERVEAGARMAALAATNATRP